MMRKAMFYKWNDVAEIMGVSRPTAYRIISKMNDELSSKGYYTQRGRISKKYFEEKTYGYSDEEEYDHVS